MIVHEPLENGGALVLERRIAAVLRGAERVERGAHSAPHPRPVAHRPAHVIEHLPDALFQRVDLLLIDQLVDGKANPRFAAGLPVAGRRHPRDAAPSVPRHANHRVHRYVHGDVLPGNGRDHRIDEKRHVVVHHFDERKSRDVAALLLGRVEDPQKGPAFAAGFAEFEVIQSGARHDRFRAAGQILVGHVREVLRQVAFPVPAVEQSVRFDP